MIVDPKKGFPEITVLTYRLINVAPTSRPSGGGGDGGLGATRDVGDLTGIMLFVPEEISLYGPYLLTYQRYSSIYSYICCFENRL